LVTTRCADAGVASAAVATSAALINANFIVCSWVDDDENMGRSDTFHQLDLCNAGQAFLTTSSETLARAARMRGPYPHVGRPASRLARSTGGAINLTGGETGIRSSELDKDYTSSAGWPARQRRVRTPQQIRSKVPGELAEPKRSDGFVSLVIKRIGQMKLTALLAASAVVLSTSLALAQSAGGPSGRGATTGDPAASSATPGSAPTTGNSMKSNPSGSGTSTSGGKDDNGDQGRDKMPESNQAVRPNNKPDKM
jgi:hypothetical protein